MLNPKMSFQIAILFERLIAKKGTWQFAYALCDTPIWPNQVDALQMSELFVVGHMIG